MPLFQTNRGSGGHRQDIFCIRCHERLLETELLTRGEGIGIRVVEGKYRCTCGYEIFFIEKYPAISGEIID